MKKLLYCLMVLLGLSNFCSSNPAPLNANESEAKEFVQTAKDKLKTLSEELRHFEYEISTTTFTDNDHNYNVFQKLCNDIAELARESKQFDRSQFKDDELKYVLEIISQQADEAILGNWWFEKILSAVRRVEIRRTQKIATFQERKVKLSYYPDIQKIIANTTDKNELKYYWKVWREHDSAEILRSIMAITDGILEAAKATGTSPLEFWMKGLNITEMENIMTETRPLYLQLHSFIRSHLNKKYGNKIIKPNGVIPDHLFRQVIAQSWTNTSIIEDIFPLNKLPPYQQILEENNYDATELYKSADGFYKSLGFDSLPENYWGSELMMDKKQDKKICKPQYFDSSANVFMIFCHKMDFSTFLEAHRYMGKMYYAREKIDLPAYFFDSHNLDNAVGEAAMLSASTLTHLKTTGLLKNFDITKEIELNRLLRMGIQNLLNIPQHFVHTKVMADFFAGKVELGLLNKHYWKLMDQYVGVGPPINRLGETYDFPEEFYIELNENRAAKKFDSAIYGYQFYKKLCQISGKYSSGSLHECDFFDSKEAGDALKKMMKLGSSKRRNKVLETMFPENPTMSSDGLMEFYRPVMNLLVEKNQEAKLETGWIPSIRKVKRVILDSGEEYEDDD